uniref:Tryptophan synthase alpha chain n=1 Tax=Acrosorium ciliolatum TaxID=1550622 RepID=A0A1Z1M2C0_9FLOR|nr:Tryptophan synthase alpha subunit [Acrosorium ciliolatum]ARW59943.1 Tryptophan synthase alpha subunit [Acrosorium ciliolatum]
MNKISQILGENRKHSTCSLIPFITAGYPDKNSTIKALYQLDRQGADIIELGIPYIDALADGPIIQEASQVALKQGIYIDDVLSILNEVTSILKSPIIIFTYYNPILVRGIDKFIMEIYNNGAQGLIVPDLPIEETDYLMYLCNLFSIELILFIAPTSSNKRISSILSKSSKCIYLVSSTGVTGMRSHLNMNINYLSNYIKSQTDKLVIIGFGISNSLQASYVSKWNIDGIVIGSAFINILSNFSMENNYLDELGSFCKEIKLAIANKDL